MLVIRQEKLRKPVELSAGTWPGAYGFQIYRVTLSISWPPAWVVRMWGWFRKCYYKSNMNERYNLHNARMKNFE